MKQCTNARIHSKDNTGEMLPLWPFHWLTEGEMLLLWPFHWLTEGEMLPLWPFHWLTEGEMLPLWPPPSIFWSLVLKDLISFKSTPSFLILVGQLDLCTCCSLTCGKMEHGTQFVLQLDPWKDGTWYTIRVAAWPVERWNMVHNSCCSLTRGKMEHGTQFVLQPDPWKDGTWYTSCVAAWRVERCFSDH